MLGSGWVRLWLMARERGLEYLGEGMGGGGGLMARWGSGRVGRGSGCCWVMAGWG